MRAGCLKGKELHFNISHVDTRPRQRARLLVSGAIDPIRDMCPQPVLGDVSTKNRDHKAYAFILGSFLSNAGTWVQNFVVLRDAYELTQSALSLALTTLLMQIPLTVAAVAGGWLASRYSSRAIACATQAGLLLQAAALVWIYASPERISPATFYGLAFVQGILSGLELPAKQMLVSAYFGASPSRLNRGVQLHWLLTNAARLAGAAGAILILQTGSLPWCFATNMLSCGLFIAALVACPPSAVHPKARGAQTRPSWTCVIRNRTVSELCRKSALVSFFVLPVGSLLASLSPDDFRAYSLNTVALAAGALSGNLVGLKTGHHDQRQLLDRLGKWAVLIVLAVALLISTRYAFLPIFLLGLVASASLASITYLIQDKAGPEAKAIASGLMFAIIYLCSSLGGVFIGFIQDTAGLHTGLLIAAAGLLGFTLLGGRSRAAASYS